MRRSTKRFLIFVALLLIIAPLGYVGLGYALSAAFETRGLRQLLSGKTAKLLNCNGGYLPLSSHGLSVFSAGFLGQASPPRALTELRASRLSARCNLAELWHGKWKIDKLSVAHLQAAYGDFAAQQINRKEFRPPQLFPPLLKESPIEVDLRDLEVRYTDVFWGTDPAAAGSFRDVHTNFYPRDKQLIVHGDGGTFQQAKWPQMQVQQLKLFYDRPDLRIDQASLTLGGSSAISVLGNCRFEQQQTFDFQVTMAHCALAPFLSESQRKKVEGEFDATAQIHKDATQTQSARAAGTLAITRAILKNIDSLKRAADFTGRHDLSPLKIDNVKGDYDWNFPVLTVKNFVLESKQLVLLRGQFTVQEQKLDGEFELGLTPDLVDKFPGARDTVFRHSADGYLWTDLTLSGTLDHLRDNLRPRLVRAAQEHFSKGLLAPIFKPGQTIIEAIQEL